MQLTQIRFSFEYRGYLGFDARDRPGASKATRWRRDAGMPVGDRLELRILGRSAQAQTLGEYYDQAEGKRGADPDRALPLRLLFH